MEFAIDLIERSSWATSAISAAAVCSNAAQDRSRAALESRNAAYGFEAGGTDVPTCDFTKARSEAVIEPLAFTSARKFASETG